MQRPLSQRPLSLICTAAIALSGLGVVGQAAAAPGLQATPSAAPANPTAAQAVPGELVVTYVAGASADQRKRACGRASARLAGRVVAGAGHRGEVELVRLQQGKNRDQAVAELRSDPSVASAEPNWIYTHQGSGRGGGTTTTVPDYFSNGSLYGVYGNGFNDDGSPLATPSGPTNDFGSQAAKAWGRGTTGSKGVYVGVIDEGIQFTHPDFTPNPNLPGQVWINPFDSANGVDDDGNGFVDDIRGWDFAGNNNTIYDGGSKGLLDDHGTHVSGTIGARNESTVPVPTTAKPQTGVVGVNQQVTLISAKFLGSGGGTLANAVKAVDYFTDLKKRHGLNIVATNNSWGGGAFSQALFDAIARANDANILFVAAAGNGGTNNDTTASYPSNYDVANVIAVAAIDKFGALASFSQYGPTTVDLGAPGVGVLSTTAFNTYSSFSGTSMAAPHVTGAAALYASTHPGATAAVIKKAILDAAIATPSLVGKTVTGGRLNVSGLLLLP